MFLYISIGILVLGFVLFIGCIEGNWKVGEFAGALISIGAVSVMVLGTISITETCFEEKRYQELLIEKEQIELVIKSSPKEYVVPALESAKDFNTKVLKERLDNQSIWLDNLTSDAYDRIELIDINGLMEPQE